MQLTDEQKKDRSKVGPRTFVEDVALLVSELEKAGITVNGSDPLTRLGMVSVLFCEMEAAKAFLELVGRYEPGRDYLYNRAIKGDRGPRSHVLEERVPDVGFPRPQERTAVHRTHVRRELPEE